MAHDNSRRAADKTVIGYELDKSELYERGKPLLKDFCLLFLNCHEL